MSNRIGYIDAMRGLAILSVVTSHIYTFSFSNSDIFEKVICNELQLPLFFLVSGLVLRVPEKNIFSVVSKRAFALCVPAAIFMLVYIWASNHHLYDTLFDAYKHGYWFTFSLFEFIVVFVCLTSLLRMLRLRESVIDIAMLILGVAILYGAVFFLRHHKEWPIVDLLQLTHFHNYIYFVVGVLMSKYELLEKLQSFRKSDVVCGGGILAFFLIHIFTYKDGDIAYLGSSTWWLMLSTLSGLFVIACAFRKYEWLSESKVGRGLQYIGRYTLDIYFIHYFIIPRHLSMVGKWFKLNPNPFIEFILAVGIAGALVIASLAISKIIRMSPTLAHWTLGVKNNRHDA